MYNEASKKATTKYIKESTRTINIRFKKDLYDKEIEPAIKKSGKPVRTFMKEAIMEKLERDNLL